MVRVLITEAHDGLGLALVKEYLADADNQVVAFCGDKTKSDQLNTLKESVSDKQLLIVPVTLTDEESIQAFVKPIEEFVDALDLLIFNPGFIPDEFSNIPEDIPTEILLSFKHILTSPEWLHENLQPLLEKGAKPMCIGMRPYSRLEEAMMFYLLDVYTLSFGWSFAVHTDPTDITVIDLSALLSRESVDEESDEGLKDMLEHMDMRVLMNQETINQKAKALYENIPKLPYGKHCYWKYTGTHLKYLNDH